MRILIVDLEYLVAMEAERILDGAFTCEIEIAMPRDYQALLSSESFDMLLIDSSVIQSAEEASRLRAAGIAILFSTLSDDELTGISEWPGVAVVAKPFDDQQLIQAVRKLCAAEPRLDSTQQVTRY